MTFDAGSIDARATLDRSAFQEGLRLAIQEGEDFQRKRFTATADLNVNTADLDRIERRVQDFANRKYTGKVDIDVAGQGLDDLTRKLDEFARKTWTAKVDLDVTAANRKLDELKARLGTLDTTVTVRVRYRPDPLPPVPVPPGGGPGGGGAGGAAGGGGGFPFLPALIGGALTMIGPLTAAATAGLIGTAGAVGTLGAAFVALKGDIKSGADETRPLLAQVDSLKVKAMGLAQTAEHALMSGLLGSLRQVRAFLPTMDPVVARLGIGLGSVAQHLTSAFTTTLTKGTPIMVEFVDMLDRGSLSLAKFVQSDRFSQFLAYAEKELPVVAHELADFTKGAVELVVAFQPIGDALLKTIGLFGRGVMAAKEFGDAVNHNVRGFVGDLDSIGDRINNPIRSLFGAHDNKTPKAKTGPSQDDIQAAQIIATKVAVAQLDDAGKSADRTIGHLASTFGVSDKAVIGYAASVGIADGALKAGSVSQRAYTLDVAAVAEANRTGTASTMAYIAAVDTFSKSAGTAADRAALIGATLKQANGDLLGYANSQAAAAVANQTFVSSMTPAVRKTIDMKTGLINYRDAASGPLLTNLQALQDAASKAAAATYQHEQATGKAGTAAAHAADQYYAQTHGALIAEARQLGLTKEQATRLADQYFAMPKDIKTRIQAIGTDPVVNVLNLIGKQLSYLTGKPWVPTVQANITPAQQNLARVQALIRATTGNKTLTVQADVSNAVRTVSRFLSSPATKVVQVVTVGGPAGPFGGRQVASAHGNIVKAYGFGGVEDQANNHQPQIFPVKANGAVRVFAEPETGGEAYVPLANDHRRPRAQAIVAQTAQMLGGAAYFADGGYGFDNVQAPVPPKRTVGGAGGGSTAGPNAAAKAAATAARSLGNTVFTEIAHIGTLLNGSAAHVEASTVAIAASVRKAFNLHFTNSAFVQSVNRETAALRQAVNERVATHAKLLAATSALNDTRSKMAGVQSNVAGAVLGGFDIGTSGNGYGSGITATLENRLADAKKFKALRDQAVKLGLDKRLVEQITQEGPQTAGKNLQAIVSGGASYVKTLNSLYGQFDATAQGIGAAQAKDDFGAVFTKQSAVVNTLTKEQTAETRKINHEVALLRADLQRLARQLDQRGR